MLRPQFKCVDSSEQVRKQKDRERYYARQGRECPPGPGAPAECVKCSASFVRTRADHAYCKRCLQDRVNEYTRDKREAERRRHGKPVRAGVSVNCQYCGRGFVRRSWNTKTCIECRSKGKHTQRYIRARVKRDPQMALNYRFGAAIRSSLRGQKSGRRWETLVGYTLADLMRHLEAQFVNGMAWDNRSDWHIDHIIPLSSFKFETPEDPDFKAAWALTNLRPLWAKDNLSKNAKRTLLL